MHTIAQALKHNSYPGRGIIIGRTADGEHNIIVYFIMGRSENSRNRIFEQCGYGIRTKAYDESKCTDPSLIIYAPVRTIGDVTIVTNGDQTDTIYDEINDGGSFESALQKRCFEPDSPNFTPRISGILNQSGYSLSILKSEDGSGLACMRSMHNYEFEDGVAHLIHTYEHDGNPIPSFRGEPVRIEIMHKNVRELADDVWQALDENNRVSLFARYIDVMTGDCETVIINRNGEN